MRGAAAARGLGMGPTDVFTEALTLGDRGQQMLYNRLGLADKTIGLNQAFYGDPFQQILGRPSGSSPQSVLAQSQGYQSGNVFSPYNNYYQDAYNYNANAQNAANIAGANASAGILGAGLGALGQIGDVGAVEALIAALKDEHWSVRKEASVALGVTADVRAVHSLVATLNDSNSEVRSNEFVNSFSLSIIGRNRISKLTIFYFGC